MYIYIYKLEVDARRMLACNHQAGISLGPVRMGDFFFEYPGFIMINLRSMYQPFIRLTLKTNSEFTPEN